MTDPMYAAPLASPLQRVQAAVSRRAETDYIFDFWTALGWTILSCGIYSFYVVYRLFWRSVEHNKRRLELFDATTALAWDRAVAEGRGDELTPRFQALAMHLGALRALTTEFREPVLWTLISVVSSGIGQIVGYVFLDMDLVRHEAAEAAAEQELAAILAALGVSTTLPQVQSTKSRHSYGGRIVALVFTCGIYGIWWTLRPDDRGQRAPTAQLGLRRCPVGGRRHAGPALAAPAILGGCPRSLISPSSSSKPPSCWRQWRTTALSSTG